MGKEEFKAFVSKNPILVEKVKNNETSWQKLYEVHTLYGEEVEAWKPYFEKKEEEKSTDTPKLMDSISSFLKNMDVKQVQSGITNVQKVLGLVSDLFIKDSGKVTDLANKNTYIPRAINRKLDD